MYSAWSLTEEYLRLLLTAFKEIHLNKNLAHAVHLPTGVGSQGQMALSTSNLHCLALAP